MDLDKQIRDKEVKSSVEKVSSEYNEEMNKRRDIMEKIMKTIKE
jgi:hypothetical protein